MKPTEFESSAVNFDVAQVNGDPLQELTDLQLVSVGGGIGETAI